MLKLSDEQWERIRRYFPEENHPTSRAGRKPVPARSILEAVLWILGDAAGTGLAVIQQPDGRRLR